MKKFVVAICALMYCLGAHAWEHMPRTFEWDFLSEQERVAVVNEHNVSLELALLSSVYFGNLTMFEYLYRIAHPVDFTIHIDGVNLSFADCIGVLADQVDYDFEMQKVVCDYFMSQGYNSLPSCNDYVGVCLSLAASRDAMYQMYDFAEANQRHYRYDILPVNNDDVLEVIATLLAIYQVQPIEDHVDALKKYADVRFTIAGLTMNFFELAQFIAFEHDYIARNNKAFLYDIMADCPQLTQEGYERFYRSRMRWHMKLARRAMYNVDYINSMCL